MRALIDLHDSLLKRRTVSLFDDFLSYTDTQLWTKGGGSSTIGAAASPDTNGLLSLVTNAAGSAEAWVATTNALYKLASGKPIYAETRVNFADADAVNLQMGVFFGFAGAFGTGLLVATTNVLKTSTQTACGFVKATGASVWSVAAQVGTTQLLQATQQSCVSTSDQILGIEIVPVSATLAEVTFKVNGQPCTYSTTQGQGAAPREVKFQWTITSALALLLGVFIKEGAGGSAETLLCDYIASENLRGTPTGG